MVDARAGDNACLYRGDLRFHRRRTPNPKHHIIIIIINYYQ
jgi:hypothetical protein